MPQMALTTVLCGAAFIALYWSLPERARPWSLAAASSAFLLSWDPVSFAVLLGLTGTVFAATWLLPRHGRWVWRTVLALIVAVFASVKSWAALGGSHGIPAIVVPIGFGFYLLKLIHYWVEKDLGSIPRHRFVTFFNYMLFFPTLLVGPIHRFEEFERGERRKRWDPGAAAEGLRHVLYGYAKVVVLANWLIAYELAGYFGRTLAPGSGAEVLGECVSYGLYLYFSFAGFSDIAIGASRLLGQKIEPNFNHPFLQRNLAAFWRSWHMSLSDWCRRYVFVPVLARWRRPAVAVVASMLAIGLWHEFTLRYVLWGLYHGLGLAAFRVFERRAGPMLARFSHPVLAPVGRGAATAATFTFVMLGFAITKNDSFVALADDLRLLVGGWSAA